MTDNSLVNLGELSKPATVLIEKIAGAVGGIFKPYQIVRVAKADAEAERIRAESQIQISDLHRRAMYRFLEEEAKKQQNIEGITRQALPLLAKESKPENVDDDWITNFFDKGRIISDQQMQVLWSKILAGEANSPGTFSKKTVNLLSDLDRRDAELFSHLCAFCWVIGGVVPLVFDVQNEIYNRRGITFDSMSHLDNLGLVQFSNFEFLRVQLPKTLRVYYCGRPLELTLPDDTSNRLRVGNVVLTKAGEELAGVNDSSPIEGFFDFVYDRWASQSYVPKTASKQGFSSDQ